MSGERSCGTSSRAVKLPRLTASANYQRSKTLQHRLSSSMASTTLPYAGPNSRLCLHQEANSDQADPPGLAPEDALYLHQCSLILDHICLDICQFSGFENRPRHRRPRFHGNIVRRRRTLFCILTRKSIPAKEPLLRQILVDTSPFLRYRGLLRHSKTRRAALWHQPRPSKMEQQHQSALGRKPRRRRVQFRRQESARTGTAAEARCRLEVSVDAC